MQQRKKIEEIKALLVPVTQVHNNTFFFFSWEINEKQILHLDIELHCFINTDT